MEELRQHLQRRSLQDHQRVLALTFMHGSRRRLDARLWEMEGGHRRWFEAATVDSFAWRIVQRWRALARARGYEVPGERQYNQTCALGAALLERPEVSSWVAATCPVVIIDEAQDLNDARSRMVAALARNCDVFLAFDDFQCLNPALLPIAVREWLGEHFSAPVRRAVIDQVTAKTAQGRASAYVYWFTRRTSVLGGRPRAFHCAELPFVFDNTYLAAYPDREEQEARGA